MLPSLHNLGWALCVIYSTIPSYWLLIHPFAPRWRKWRRSPYVALLPVWIATWIVFAAITWPWRSYSLYESAWSWLPALVFFALGIRLYVRARHRFSGAMLAGHPELNATSQQRLITTGIRARIRHPIYAGHLCELLAWSIGTGLAVCYGLTLFALLTGALMIHLEDEELERRFGQQAREYRSRVPAIVPRLSR